MPDNGDDETGIILTFPVKREQEITDEDVELLIALSERVGDSGAWSSRVMLRVCMALKEARKFSPVK